MEKAHQNKPFRYANKGENDKKRDMSAKRITRDFFVVLLGWRLKSDLEKEYYSKYDIAFENPRGIKIKAECESRNLKDFDLMFSRKFDTFRVYGRKINDEAEWNIYVSTCEHSPYIMVTTYKSIQDAPHKMIKNSSWGEMEPVYEVPADEWVCFNRNTGSLVWGDNEAIIEALGLAN